MADPVGFTSAFGKLEQAIRELVGAGDVKERLKVATMALAGVKLVERFIVLLRRKLLLRLIQELRQEKEEGKKSKAAG